MNISTADARGLYTKMLADVYRERPKVMSFLRSFFPAKEYSTLEISIEVQRGTEKIASDVTRGTEGNRNKFSLSTEKTFIPPYYREFFDSTDLRLYDRLFGSTSIDSGVFSSFLEEVADKLGMCQDKIERAIEKQCADVFHTGIVTLEQATSINFGRKSESIVNLSVTAPWTGANNPYTALENAAIFLRQTGKAQGATFNVILGTSAWNAFLVNSFVIQRNDLKAMQLDMITTPQRNSVGAAFHGTVTAGSYTFRMWTYPEIYETAAGVKTKYIADTKIIVLPENPRFQTSFAACPQLITESTGVKKGAFMFGDYKDERLKSHIFDVMSAPIALPVSIDQIYTAQVTVA
jgi:hypothetical protein